MEIVTETSGHLFFRGKTLFPRPERDFIQCKVVCTFYKMAIPNISVKKQCQFGRVLKITVT